MAFESAREMLSLDAAFWVLEPLGLELLFTMMVMIMIVSYDVFQVIVVDVVVANDRLVMVVVVVIFVSDKRSVMVVVVDVFYYGRGIVVLVIAVLLAFWFISMAEVSCPARNNFGLLADTALVIVVLSGNYIGRSCAGLSYIVVAPAVVAGSRNVQWILEVGATVGNEIERHGIVLKGDFVLDDATQRGVQALNTVFRRVKIMNHTN